MRVWGYEWVRALKKETGKTIPELLALQRGNDPFFVGSSLDKQEAKWFARMWEKQYAGRTGVHLRRVYYRLGAIGFKKLDGTHAVQVHARRLGLPVAVLALGARAAFSAC